MHSESKINTRIEEILRRSKTIAVVGLSDNPMRSSYGVGIVLQREGYEVIPVNPSLKQWRGLHVYPDLKSIPKAVDVVNVFRRSEFVPEVVEEAIEIGAKAVWMQVGVVHQEAAQRALDAGLDVVMDRCIAVEVVL